MLYTPVPGTPLHAEHRANGTLLSHGGVPRRRHPRAAALQLPPPAHPERRGDGVPAAGLPPRLRGERPERHPHRADAPAGLARPQGPPRRPRPREDRLRDEGPEDAVRGGAVGLREVVRAREPGARLATAGDARGRGARVRLEGASRGPRRGPGRARDPLARGAAACDAASPTSRRPSTRRTLPPPRGPRSPRGAPPTAGGSSRRQRRPRRKRWPEAHAAPGRTSRPPAAGRHRPRCGRSA